MKEVEVRPAGFLRFGEGGVELVCGHRNAQGGEVGEDLVTQAWGCFRRVRLSVFLRTGLHRRIPRVRANAGSRWSGVDRSRLRATTGQAFRDADRRVHPGAVWAG